MLGDLRHGLQAPVGGPPEPAGKELLGRPEVRVVPEVAQALLEGPGIRPFSDGAPCPGEGRSGILKALRPSPLRGLPPESGFWAFNRPLEACKPCSPGQSENRPTSSGGGAF